MHEARITRSLNIGLVVLLAAIGTLSFHRGVRGRFDFRHFYLDARYVWVHRALNPHLPDPRRPVEHESRADDSVRQLPFYLPVVPLALAPLTAGGQTRAALAWAAVQVAALAAALRILRGWARVEGPDAAKDSAVVFAVAVGLALPAIVEAAKFNQLTLCVLALAVAGLTALERRRRVLGGVLLGAAAVLKILPGLLLLWLLVKREWRAAGAMVAAAAILVLLPPLIAFGPERTLAYHREWWDYNIRGDSARGLVSPQLAEHFIDRRNQSVAQVVARLAWPEHPYRVGPQVAQLELEHCLALAAVITGALLIALLGATRQPAAVLGLDRRRAEAATYLVAMLALAPLVRQYYLAWALPALVVLARAAHAKRRCGQAGLLVWVAGMLLWMWPAARLVGAHLVMLLVLGGLVLACARNAGNERGTSGASPAG